MTQKYFTIKNCEFTFKCPRMWERLDTTDRDDKRYCESCEKPVFLCLDDATLARHVEAGHCVAISDPAIEGAYEIGKIESAYNPEPALRIVN